MSIIKKDKNINYRYFITNEIGKEIAKKLSVSTYRENWIKDVDPNTSTLDDGHNDPTDFTIIYDGVAWKIYPTNKETICVMMRNRTIQSKQFMFEDPDVTEKIKNYIVTLTKVLDES